MFGTEQTVDIGKNVYNTNHIIYRIQIERKEIDGYPRGSYNVEAKRGFNKQLNKFEKKSGFRIRR